MEAIKPTEVKGCDKIPLGRTDRILNKFTVIENKNDYSNEIDSKTYRRL